MKLVAYIASLIWLVAIAAVVLALRSPAADTQSEGRGRRARESARPVQLSCGLRVLGRVGHRCRQKRRIQRAPWWSSSRRTLLDVLRDELVLAGTNERSDRSDARSITPPCRRHCNW